MSRRLLVLALVSAFAVVGAGTPGAGGVSPVTITVDAYPVPSGTQATRDVTIPFNVDVLVGSVTDLRALNFELEYDQTILDAPTIASGPDVDRNPDADETFLQSTGRSWVCSPPSPSGDTDPSGSVGVAFISCFSSGGSSGTNVTMPEKVIATVQFNVVGTGTSSLTIRNANTFSAGGTETGSCNPVVINVATCTGATITAPVNQGGSTDSDGDGCSDQKEVGPDETLGGQRDYANPWDFYDVTGVSGTPDGVIDLLFDILGVIQHYAPTGAPPYDAVFDRGPSSGPNPWNMTPPDGSIDLLNDILGVIQQYSHDCR